jgi:cell division transport system ATP-binding protein
MITFQNVTKRYTTGAEALTNVNFHIKKSEMVFLTGHSGAGKSTLLKLIMGVEASTRGHIQISDYELNALSPRDIPFLRRNIGMIYQDHRLINDYTVFDNVALPLRIANMDNSEITRRTHAALDIVGLLAKRDCYPLALSGGEQQRVGIARAVVNKPDILLADEPTGNLDQQLGAQIFDLFHSFNQVGVTVLVATHNLSLIARRPERVLTLTNGQLLNLE